MKFDHRAASLCALVFLTVAAPSYGADRMRAGQWNGTTVVGDRTFSSSSCLSRSDADAMNGDSNSIRLYLETIISPGICKITDVKATGNQVIYTASCGSAPSRVVTASYHGDSFEGSDSTGTKTAAKLVGPCK